MRPLEALREIMDRSGLSGYGLARKLGKGRAYINNYYHKGLMPRVDTFATIIDACGYDLIARSRTGDHCVTITQENEDSVESYLE